MLLCRAITGKKNLWEIRSKLSDKRISRILFFNHNGKMILLHGFIKKSQKTPDSELNLAMKRKKEYETNG